MRGKCEGKGMSKRMIRTQEECKAKGQWFGWLKDRKCLRERDSGKKVIFWSILMGIFKAIHSLPRVITTDWFL